MGTLISYFARIIQQETLEASDRCWLVKDSQLKLIVLFCWNDRSEKSNQLHLSMLEIMLESNLSEVFI